MALNFPSSPSSGQKHSENGTSWEWDGSSWNRVTGLISTDAGTLAGIGLTQFARRDQNNVITGINTFVGNVKIEGVLTYEDVKNIDSIGIVTAREGIKIPDDKEITFGAGDDGSIKSDGSNFLIQGGGGGTGITYVRGRTLSLSANGGSGGFNGAVTIDKSGDERVRLKYGSGTKLETTSYGIDVTGVGAFSGDIRLEADGGAGRLEIGALSGGDLQLYHDTNSYIINKTGDIYIYTSDGNDFYVAGQDGHTIIKGTDGSSVELFYNNSKKLETTNTGATVTGTLTATTFSGNLTGNVTGNTSGSSGSCTGNSATASVATNVTVADESSDTSCNVLFATAATGNLPPKTGTNLTFNSSTGQLTATSYAGDGSNLTGIDATAIQTGNTSVQTATYSISNTVANVGIVTVQPSGLTATGISTFTEIKVTGEITASHNVIFTGQNYNAYWDKSVNALQFSDNAKATWGNHAGAGDLQIYHSSSDNNSYIKETGSGSLVINADDFYLQNNATTTYLRTHSSGAIDLNYSGNKKLETTNTGATVTGTLTATAFSGPLTGNVTGNTSGSSGSCTGNAATATALQNARTIGGVSFDGTANINLPGVNAAGNQNTTGTAAGLTGTPSIAVNSVTGVAATFTGNLVVGGVLTYEDVTNIDSVGIITARDHLVVNADNKRLKIGAGADLQIYHDGSNTYQVNSTGSLVHRSTGEIFIQSDAGVRLTDVGNNETFLRCIDNGAVQLYHDNSKKFETISSGVSVTGHVHASGAVYSDNFISTTQSNGHSMYIKARNAVGNESILLKGTIGGSIELNHNTHKKLETTADGIEVTGKIFPSSHIDMADNVKLLIGTGDDIEVFHDGNHSYIDNHTGNLKIRNAAAGNILIQARDDEEGIIVKPDGAVELYYDNVKKFETTAAGTNLLGTTTCNSTINLYGELNLSGSPQDKYFDASITDGSTDYWMNFRAVRGNDASEHTIQMRYQNDGAVELNHNGTKKFETRSDGVLVSGNIQLNDSNRLDLGNNGDLRLYHDGSNSYIADEGTGDIIISSGTITFKNQARNETHANFIGNGACQLYHNNVKKFETAAQTQLMYGNLELTDGGSLYLDNGFNNQVAQIVNAEGSGASDIRFSTKPSGGSLTERLRITASGNVFIPNDTGKFMCGASGDLTIWHDGSNSRVRESGTGNLRLEGTVVELWGDGSKQLNTFANGIQVTGISCTSGIDITADSQKIRIGASQDLQIYHDGTQSVIKNATGNLDIITGSTSIDLQGNDGSETLAKFIPNGAVELYHDNSKKLETSTYGIAVTGYISCSGHGYGYTAGDNVKISLGNSNDFQIYHNGSDSVIVDQGTGNLNIYTNGAGVNIQKSDGENMARFFTDGACELFYNNSKKFETTNNGGTLTGDWFMTTNGYLSFPNNVQALFGTGTLMRIYHNGSNAIISNSTGYLNIESNNGFLYLDGTSVHIRVGAQGGEENAVVCNQNGSVDLYYDNNKKFETRTGGTRIYGKGQGTTFSASQGMHADDRCGLEVQGALTGIKIASTYNDASHPEYGLVFVQGPSTSSYNCWSISPDGPARGNNLRFHYQAQSGNIHVGTNCKVYMTGNGDWIPYHGNTSDLGTSSKRWNNLYVNDMHFSNEGKDGGNDVDGTTGDWTLQEGETDIYMINNKTGKKYKIALQEVN